MAELHPNPEDFRAEATAFRAGRHAAARTATAVVVVLIAAVGALSAWLGLEHAGLLVGGGTALIFLSYFAVFRGGPLAHGATRGHLAGLIPLGAALAARPAGHLCAGGQCFSACVPICACAALAAAAWIAYRGVKTGAKPLFFLAAGSTATLVGALGCSCIAATGALATAAVTALILAPAAVIAGKRVAA